MLKISRYELGYKFLIAYIYVLLFGSWIMRLVGIPASIGLLVVAAMDVLPLGIWILSNPSFRIKTKRIFVDTFAFWILWFLVLILLLFTTIQHGGVVITVLVHWGALIRYIPLACIVVSLGKHIKIEDRIIGQFRILASVLIVIGYLCIILGERASFFLPYLSENATSERSILIGQYSAVFANTIDYAFILIVLYIVFIYQQGASRLKTSVLTLIYMVVIFKTGSAIATAVFLFIAFFRLTQGKNVARYSLIAMFMVLIIILGYEYWDLVMLVVDNAKLSRLGMLTLTAPDFISEMSFDTFFGVGNDGHVVLDKVNGYKEQVVMLTYAEDGNISFFGDVYWVALLVFHGFIGLGIIFYLYYSLYKTTSGRIYSDTRFDYNRIIKWLFFSVVIFAFLNQVIVVKTFALVFWIFLAIIYNKTQRNENTSNK